MVIKTIDLEKEQFDLSEMLSLIKDGTEIILTQDSKPVARLSPIASANPRVLGLHAGSGWISDDFDDPLPDEFWVGP